MIGSWRVRAPCAVSDRSKACLTARCSSASRQNTAKLFFSVPKKVAFGSSVGLVGSTESAGNWDPSKGLTLSWNDNDSWSGELEAPVGQQIEYKFFTRNAAGSIEEWQPGNNLVLDVPNAHNAVLLVTDDWEGNDRIVSVQSEEEVKQESASAIQAVNPLSATTEAPSTSISSHESLQEPEEKEQPQSSSQPALPKHPQPREPEPSSPGNGRQPGISSLQYDAAVQTGVAANGVSSPPGEDESSAETEQLEVPTQEELETLKVKELKGLLKERDLPTTGRKADLIKRLQDGWSSILNKA